MFTSITLTYVRRDIFPRCEAGMARCRMDEGTFKNGLNTQWSFEIDWTPESHFVGLRSLHKNFDPRNRLGAAVPVLFVS